MQVASVTVLLSVTEHTAAAATPPAGRPQHTDHPLLNCGTNKLHCFCEHGHVVHLLFVYFMFYFVFQNKIHTSRNVVDSCDKHQTDLLIIILIANVRQYLRRHRPDTNSMQALQGASCTPTVHCQSVCPVPSPSLLSHDATQRTQSSNAAAAVH